MNWLSMLGGQQQPQTMDNPMQAQQAYQRAMEQQARAQQMQQSVPNFQGGGAAGWVSLLANMLGGRKLEARADESVSQALSKMQEFDTAAKQQQQQEAMAAEEKKFQRELERDRKKAEEAAKNRAPSEFAQLLESLPEDQRQRAALIKAGLAPQAQAPQQPRNPTEFELRMAQAKALGATPEQLQQMALGSSAATVTPERREDAKLQTSRLKDAEERARAAQKTLDNVTRMEELMKGGLSTGPMDQYLPGRDRGLFDSLAADLNLSTLRQNFGGNPTEGERVANAATLPGSQQYEDNNRQQLARLRNEAQGKIDEYKSMASGQRQPGTQDATPMVAVNPQTGERLVLRNGQWVSE